MKTLKTCLVILCLLHFRAVGLPQFSGANFYMKSLVINSVTFGNQNVLIDDEDFELVNQYTWHIQKGHSTFYAVSNYWKWCNGNKKCITICMHRLIMGVKNKKIFIDHKDHNGLNNQKYNLRSCTHSQNARNRVANIGRLYRGTHLRKKTTTINKWTASISYNKKSFFLGYFKTEKEAALAYNQKAVELHGEFANLNIIL